MNYEKPKIEIVMFYGEDVITTSNLVNGGTGEDLDVDFGTGFDE